MQVTVNDNILKLATGISGGAVNLNDMLLLAIGCFLLKPAYRIGELGDLLEITYRSKDGTVFTHKFHRPPKLAFSQSSLFILNNDSGFNVIEGTGIFEKADFARDLQHPKKKN